MDPIIHSRKTNHQIINNQTRTEQSFNKKSTNNCNSEHQFVLLATAQTKALSPKGFAINVRLLIDQGSELSFITTRLVHQLQLERKTSTIELMGIGGTSSGHTKGVVTVTLQSARDHQQTQLTAHILNKLTTRLPSFTCRSSSIGSLENLHLADEHYLTPGIMDIIIGADSYGRIIRNEVVRSSRTQLVGQHTIFGWIITGPICCESCSTATSLSAVKKSSNEQLHELLQRFWCQEELPPIHDSKQILSPEDQQCEQHFQLTHSREPSGRYVVRLPLRIPTSALGESRGRAERQLKGVLKRLSTDPTYAKLYKEFIKEYEDLGHMKRASDSSEVSPTYYLPHHGVLREDTLTTKLRVVFNGSSPTSTQVSLNDLLYPGVKLQTDAMNVLTWLRKHQLVFGTDIVKMFRQINVHEDDWDLQRILWYNEEEKKITAYQLTTVTYGLNCSPWHALRCLQQLVSDEGHRFPAAIEAISKGRYVDDIYGGANTEDHLEEIIKQLIGLCHAGGFSLQKWTSNCPQVLQRLGLASATSPVEFENSIIKVLGMCWNPSKDSFTYKSRKFTEKLFTKRKLLSEIAQIFDPLGFIAPVVVKGKMIIQHLWSLKLNWDDQLPLEYVRQWNEFRGDLHELHQLSIPRWLHLEPTIVNIQIHGFADASTAAMSAVVYLRTTNITDDVSIAIVCAKTKVAPLKRMTIPRLELSASVMLAHLVDWTTTTLGLKNAEVFLWSDSTVALSWIKSHPSKWKDFVHNRVVKIQETVPTASWRHISGLENPADCASRGVTPHQLADHPLWWTGPDWLAQEKSNWPHSNIEAPPEASVEEKVVKAHPVAIRAHALAELMDRYSTLEKLQQVTATLHRVIERFKRQPSPDSTVLSTIELNDARLFWIKITQMQYFNSVLLVLTQGNQLPTRHPLAKLTPILDDKEIIRLGGRLKNSQLNPDEVHPIILPRQSRLTTLIIEQAHRRTLHGGTQVTLAFTRQKYWIIGGRGTVRAYIHRCVTCTRHRGQLAHQHMGQLPSQRVTPARAFLHTGVDYAGPFPILKWRPTNAQPASVHIVVFVCFTTSAIHLELVARQTADSFIAAYKRFTGRRGIPEMMYSDNSTTFTGASTVLSNLYQQPSSENRHIQAALATNGTQWSFIPPRAPHFGGKWEAAVKSVKYHLKRVLGTQTFTYEELLSVLIQIEACLNWRPISPMSDDPDDLQALTPGHFLIGDALHLLPEPSYLNQNPNKMQRWNLITQKVQQFWKRWSKECLQRYQTIYKWNSRQRNINVGDLVLMVQEEYPPAKWPIARVIKVSPGADGLTRVAIIKTAHAEVSTRPDGTPRPDKINLSINTFVRPITKLCLLPVSSIVPDERPEIHDDQRSDLEDEHPEDIHDPQEDEDQSAIQQEAEIHQPLATECGRDV